MIGLASTMYQISAAGEVKRVTGVTGQVVWTPAPVTTMTRVFAADGAACPSAAAFVVAVSDVFISISQPFTSELPEPILEVIREDPTSVVSESYRRYVRTVLMPSVRAVATIIRDHWMVMDLPSKAWYVNFERFESH
eukprot:SAG31_NODE_1297_length_8934_cov_26.567176_13_plen_137_part_00